MNEMTINMLEKKSDKKEEKGNYTPVEGVVIEHIDKKNYSPVKGVYVEMEEKVDTSRRQLKNLK